MVHLQIGQPPSYLSKFNEANKIFFIGTYPHICFNKLTERKVNWGIIYFGQNIKILSDNVIKRFYSSACWRLTGAFKVNFLLMFHFSHIASRISIRYCSLRFFIYLYFCILKRKFHYVQSWLNDNVIFWHFHLNFLSPSSKLTLVVAVTPQTLSDLAVVGVGVVLQTPSKPFSLWNFSNWNCQLFVKIDAGLEILCFSKIKGSRPLFYLAD